MVALLAVVTVWSPGLAHRFHFLTLTGAFDVAIIGFVLGMLALAIALAGLLLALFGRVGRYRLRALLALVLGLLAFVPPLMFAHRVRAAPAIHDISTDTAHPPAFQALLSQRTGATNPPLYGGPEVAAVQHAAYPDIQPLQFDTLPANTFDAASDVARSMGWKIAATDPRAGRIEATATTFWFGLQHDVVIRVQPDAHGTRVDIRSESRVGNNDMGIDAAIVRAFSRKLRATLGVHSLGYGR
jgi:uncharacterized protein (DUF1499 family)